MNLYLIGYRGTGKSTVARLIAEKLGRPCFDADAVIEEQAGRSIRQIFAQEGEAGFRDRESAVLQSLASQRNAVVATGGGVILREPNRRLLRTGRVIWLTAPPACLWQRLQTDQTTAERRPNLSRGGLSEIEELLRVRQPLYQECAACVVETENRTPAAVADLVVAWLADKKDAGEPPSSA